MISCRDAVSDDLDAMHRLLQALAEHDGTGRVASIDALRKHGFGDRRLFETILAEDAGEAIGLVVFYPDFSTLRGEPGVYVQDLYVVEGRRGVGVGRLLLSEAIKTAESSWGARYLTLGVSPENTLAISAYETMGFRPRGYNFLIIDGADLVNLTGPP